ncbi:MAG: peptidoglycan DD-metalloendopeptidase family protein [Rickettsiales bacterium]|nr:peptidoglycan DD-metalloendopeptidase family protein [Rickettsiales bacterium]
MSKSYFLTKKQRFPVLLNRTVVSALNGIRAFCKLVFVKRTILFVSNRKIRTINLSIHSQAILLVAVLFAGKIFVNSLKYNSIINEKSEEIRKLKTSNNYFEEEISNINDKLKKVNDYLISITGNKQEAGTTENNFKQPKNIKEKDLSKSDKHTLNGIKDATFQLNEIQATARRRINNIEEAIASTGLNLKKMPNIKQLATKSKKSEKEISLNRRDELLRGQGGALDDEMRNLENASSDELEKHLEKAQFASEFDRLFLLEKLVSVMPLSRPMKNYYISSGFGVREDPKTGHGGDIHKGLDFVGAKNANIISPAGGRVILAGRYSDYGNAVVIDHGFGITTRYGHLSSVKVAKGQVVKKGQIIAAQGNTGRSTGPHLHYEVRYRGTPLNPKKFLEAGDFLFNDAETVKYVNS